MDQQLNENGTELLHRLATVGAKKAGRHAGQHINVAGVGSIVSAAYEQLRNSTEYMQDHLLRQRAIRRFYIRNLPLTSKKAIKHAVADELIIELTQAGYIENNSLYPSVTVQLLDAIQKHYSNYWRMLDSGLRRDYAYGLTLDLLSAESENLIGYDEAQASFTLFAYHHYVSVLNPDDFAPKKDADVQRTADTYENNLYIAVHKALCKSDLAAIHYDLQRLHSVPDDDINAYVRFFITIDQIYHSRLNDRLTRHISKYGAPMRILKSMIENTDSIEALLANKEQFLDAYRSRINRSYEEARDKLNKGVIKSIIFLLITKALIGIAVEIPYDILITGSIAVLPLVINLLTPIIYMVIVRFGLKLPGGANSQAILQYSENILYGSAGRELYATPKRPRYSVGFTIAYALMFIIVFGLVIGQLAAWNFNIVQGAIFFIFLATASFLGFRLSHIVRELELVAARPGIVATVRDFFFMPFILLGQWLTSKYAKVNIVTVILDTVIELPLKTILRLVRQWTDFLREKQEGI